MLKGLRRLGWLGPALLALPARLLAEGSAAMVFVADSRRYTGWETYLTNLYNDSLLEFTLLTVVAVPIIALILGAAMGFLLARTGLDLRAKARGA